MKMMKSPGAGPTRGLVAVLVAAVLALLAGAAVVAATGTASAQGTDKYFVCKYVGTPGVDEELQTGDNPISVSESSLPQPVVVGSFFADEQGRSYVLMLDDTPPGPEGDPGVEECPPAEVPEQPDPLVDVTTETRKDCEGVESRTKTVTTEYVLNQAGTEYVLGAPGSPVWSDWMAVRDLTAAESDALNCEKAIAPTETTKTPPAAPAPAVTPVAPVPVPTAVSAGIRDADSASPVGQGLLAGGLVLLMLAGAMWMGRRRSSGSNA